jgi:hypothetical protein
LVTGLAISHWDIADGFGGGLVTTYKLVWPGMAAEVETQLIRIPQVIDFSTGILLPALIKLIKLIAK